MYIFYFLYTLSPSFFFCFFQHGIKNTSGSSKWCTLRVIRATLVCNHATRPATDDNSDCLDPLVDTDANARSSYTDARRAGTVLFSLDSYITVVLIDDTGDAILEVDYHPNNALRYAFERLGLDGDSVSSLLPWKTRMEVGKEHIAMFSQPLGLDTEAFLE